MVPSHIYNKDLYSLRGPHVPYYEVQLLLSPAISTFHRMAAACLRPNGQVKSQPSTSVNMNPKIYMVPGMHYLVFYVIFLMFYQLSKYS